jgi:predicted glycoside hydrolase/deacetylase ChbG (UPF0249 family)
LIVNGDDFGASRGINRGIVELHQLGVLTSTSLMIAMPAANDAVSLARKAPALGVGLHVTLTHEDGTELVDFHNDAACAAEIQRQIARFSEQLGRLPTHIDSHQNVHRDQRLRPLFQAAAARYGLPLREHSPARYFSSFYGQWEGEPHPEQIGVENLLRMLDGELHDDGITELSCHPGYCEPDFVSPYDAEREIEVRTLSDKRLRTYLRAKGVKLISFADVFELSGSACGA